MSEYYGVSTPTESYLAHYGVRGMKWGIRKVRPVGSSGPHAFGYRRAQRKLARLEAKANRQALLKKADRLDKVSKGARVAGRVGLGAAAVGTAGSIGSRHLVQASIRKFNNDVARTVVAGKPAYVAGKFKRASAIKGPGDSGKELVTVYNKSKYDRLYNQAQNKQKAYHQLGEGARKVQAVGAGVAALGYGTAIGSKLRANALRRKANNTQALKAAKQKANAYRQQMNAKYGISKSKKRR